MSMRDGSSGPRLRVRRGLGLGAGALALGVALSLGVPALPVGAAPPAAPGPRPGVCLRVRHQFARAVIANKRAKAAFARASALRARLLRAGRTNLAHRLDARLRYLRQLHTLLVDRVQLVAARAGGACSVRPPVLDSY